MEFKVKEIRLGSTALPLFVIAVILICPGILLYPYNQLITVDEGILQLLSESLYSVTICRGSNERYNVYQNLYFCGRQTDRRNGYCFRFNLSELTLAVWLVFTLLWLARWGSRMLVTFVDGLLVVGWVRTTTSLNLVSMLRWLPGHFEHADGSGHDPQTFPGLSTQSWNKIHKRQHTAFELPHVRTSWLKDNVEVHDAYTCRLRRFSSQRLEV